MPEDKLNRAYRLIEEQLKLSLKALQQSTFSQEPDNHTYAQWCYLCGKQAGCFICFSKLKSLRDGKQDG